MQLPSGSYVQPGAIMAIEARTLRHPHIEADGSAYPAVVYVETRHQVLKLGCSTSADAVALRERLRARVEEHHAMVLARHRSAKLGEVLP